MVEENYSKCFNCALPYIFLFLFLTKNICIVQKSYLNFQINANYIVLNTNNIVLFTYIYTHICITDRCNTYIQIGQKH